MDTKGPEKKQRLLAALEQGMVMIHIDARRPGVLVPPQLKEEPHLRLNLSYRFDAQDLAVGEWGIRCTLHFSGVRFTVAVPWNALFAIRSHVSEEFWMYPDDMPPEVIQQGLASAARVPARPQVVPEPRLREAPPPPSPAAQGQERDPDEPKPRGRGHLRVVK